MLFGFAGGASRRVYLLGRLGSAVVLIVAMLIADPKAFESQSLDLTPAGWSVAALGWWSWFALLVKRLKDVCLGWGSALLLLDPGFQRFVLLGFALPKSRDEDSPIRRPAG
jgi:hypothetical protein